VLYTALNIVLQSYCTVSHFSHLFTVYSTTLLVSDNTAWNGTMVGDTNWKRIWK